MSSLFTHLETHSYYTLLGSTLSVADLVARAAAEGMTHLALTDTNVLYGVLAFNRACQAAGLQAIVGLTVTVAAEAWPSLAAEKDPGHLVLLATDPAGYRSLCRLSSLIQSRPEREQLAARGLDWAALAEHREGLICLSGGRRGWIERLLRAGDEAAARDYARRLADIYGDNAWLSLELHPTADEAVAREMVTMGQQVGLPCAAVQPVYCLTRQDRAKLRLLAAIDRNCRLEELPPDDPTLEQHWLSPDEIARRFANFPEAVTTVAEIAARCSLALPDGRPSGPHSTCPPARPQTTVWLVWLRTGWLNGMGRRRRQRSGAACSTNWRPSPARLRPAVSDRGRHRGLRPPGRRAGQYPRQRGQLPGGLLYRHHQR